MISFCYKTMNNNPMNSSCSWYFIHRPRLIISFPSASYWSVICVRVGAAVLIIASHVCFTLLVYDLCHIGKHCLYSEKPIVSSVQYDFAKYRFKFWYCFALRLPLEIARIPIAVRIIWRILKYFIDNLKIKSSLPFSSFIYLLSRRCHKVLAKTRTQQPDVSG